MKKLWQRIKRASERAKPTAATQQGMGIALRLAALLLLLTLLVLLLRGSLALGSVLGSLVLVAGLVGIAFLARFLIALTFRLHPGLRFGLLLFGAVALPYLGGFESAGSWLIGGTLALFVVMIGGGIASQRSSGWRWHNIGFTAIGVVGAIALVFTFLLPGWQVEEEIEWTPMTSQKIKMASPGEPGGFAVERFTYGSGRDLHRAEFGGEVSFVSEPVDARALLDGWEAGAGWARSRYWGFGPESLPVQGRAFVPEGDGPYPVVLIVHGNHLMEDYSDAGYAYLGEHFASRGFATVSLDQNFLNSSLGDSLSFFDGGLDEENDARAWLLLMHLRQLSQWNEQADHAWYGKLDLDRVVLIGHSRGGEAVSEAAVFNRLSAYPDDASLAFDFDFGVKGVVAIAPVDHQYSPRGRPTAPVDVSYLVLHGSHDGDVNSFAGAALYSRLEFDACDTCFKTGIYLIGANHGQFNTSWGRRDAPAPFSNLFNLSPIMDPETQRAMAIATITAFLEATLHDDETSGIALASPDRVHQLLPKEARYLSQFRHAQDEVLADFEEDADVATGSDPNVRMVGSGLALWREGEIDMKWGESSNASVVLGWNDEAESPSYSLDFFGGRALPSGSSVAFALAMSDAEPGEVEGYESPDEIDFTLALTDSSGNQGRLALSLRRPLLPQVKPTVYKLEVLDSDPPTEVVFQRYRFVVDEWLVDEPALDLDSIAAISLMFDRTQAGAIVLDDVVISNEGY